MLRTKLQVPHDIGNPVHHADKQQLAIQLYKAKKTSVKKICEMLEISKHTLYAYVRASSKG
jgi:predicted transcriptional regulator YheO